jgi:hypothetical protein
MSKYFIIAVVSTCVLSFACGGANQTTSSSTTINSSVNNSAVATKPETNSTMPPTEKDADGDFVPSETGTEKAKPAAGKANVQGRVVFNEKPAAGVEVKLCERFSQYVGGCDGEKFTTKTDANGEYLFKDVTPREYDSLLVRVFDTKNYIFASGRMGISSAKYKIEADKTFFAPDTKLFKDDLKVTNPLKNAKADAQNLELKWDTYPDAAYYKIRLTGKGGGSTIYFDEKVEGTSFKIDKPMTAGTYTLNVIAFNANDVKLSEAGDGVEFTAQGGAEPAPANK